MEAKRIVFNFDEKSFKSLEEIKKEGHYSSYADAVRKSLQINRALQAQEDQGFNEIVVRNPKTKEEKVLIIP